MKIRFELYIFDILYIASNFVLIENYLLFNLQILILSISLKFLKKKNLTFNYKIVINIQLFLYSANMKGFNLKFVKILFQ